MNIAPELVERFRTDLCAIWPNDGQAKLGIAFSGGPDSLALLLLSQTAFPGRVEAATVDHGLRAESAEEARAAASICRTLGVPHAVISVEVASGNLQSEARSARYAALAEWAKTRGIETICTAHHADDQAETFLMRANRGSGLAGLCGVRAEGTVPGSDLALVRPLLGWRRKTLEDIVEASSFEAVSDPSNEDEAFDRVRMRNALANSDFIDVEGLSRSARILAEMQASIDELAKEEWARARAEDGAPARYLPFARSGVRRNAFLAEVIRQMGDDFGVVLSRSDAARIVDDLLEGWAVNIAGIQARAREEEGEPVWSFEWEKPRKTS